MFEDEYEPLRSSGANPKKMRAYAIGAASAVMVLFLFVAVSGSSSTAVPVQAAQIQQVPQQAVQFAQPQSVAEVIQQQHALTSEEQKTNLNVVQPTLNVEQPTVLAAAGDDAVFSAGQYDFIYNILSFAIASMGASTVFFFFQFSLVNKSFRTALVITGLVTLIAFYHYIRIFNSFTEAYTSVGGVITATGIPFNDAYRYVDWLLTVPLLLMELILVMDLSSAETRAYCIRLGLSAAIMIVLGYPGEISDSHGTRWMFWALAMLPFIFIVYTLFVGLSDAVANQPEDARGLVNGARWVTVLSWCTYPIVYIFPMLGLEGAGALTAIQVGYSVADVIAKPILGLMVWKIAACKSAAQQ